MSTRLADLPGLGPVVQGRVAPAGAPDLAVLDPLERPRSAADYAFGRLRGAIISLALPPGTLLGRAAIAARLGVSQTPVREAMIRLQEESLIEVVPHSATRVSRIDLENARRAHFLRLAVELEVVRTMAAAPAPETVERLRAELAGLGELLARGDLAGFAAADEEFHGVLYAAAEVPELWDLVRSRSGHLDRLRRLHLPSPGKAEAILREHELLTEAIIGRDAQRAERRLRHHLSGTFAEAGEIRRAHPEFF